MSTGTSPSRPRRVWRHVVFGCALLALLPTFAACVPVVPPSGPGNASFKNVAVTTTSTAATITFTSPVPGAITVTVGTSPDPTTSKVGEVVLAHQASLKYSATIGGLKPKTGYSFRLAAAGVTPYTDITLLVTKPPVFRNVMTHVHNVDATIDFDYDGVGPVTVTISKTL